ncbi:fibronectin type III domain-containing protein [Mumia quercus]|uniref:fibronectin type III domain-containing protein n=1 Tax=Mumia quercus TaxID=2976125 RepID=UPI0021CFB979|nr:fibronectin type III domain-containing protein [Mumia quercus]
MRRALASSLTAVSLASGSLVLASAPQAAAADVDLAPDRVLTGFATGLQRAVGLALGPDGRIFVSNFWDGTTPGSVRVFEADATGNRAPSAVLDSTSPLMSFLTTPKAVAVGADGRLHMAAYNDNTIRTFTVPATGNGFTMQTAIGSSSMLSAPNDLALTSATSLWVTSGATDEVVRFDVGSPTRVRTLSTQAPIGVAVDGSSLYVTGGNGVAPYVKVFTSTATGPDTPSRTLTGPATGLTHVAGVAVDRYGRVYVADHGDEAIRVFAAGATGNTAPVTVIKGPATQLERPTDLALDPAGRLWVANDVVPGRVVRFPALAAPPAPRPPAPPAPAVTAPSKPRALKVNGKAGARKRTIRWKAPAATGGTRILRYKVVIRKGKKVLVSRTLGPSARKLVVKRSTLRSGTLTVRVRAVNGKGAGPNAVKRFRVRR